MGLNIVTKTGDFDPWVKFNSKAGRWYVKDGESEKEIANPTFIADIENIKTGWFYFRAGAAPEKVFDASISSPAPKPDRTYVDDKGVTRDCFKRGFELRLFSNSAFGGVVVLNGASMHINDAINSLHDAYEIGKSSNVGLVPVVSCTGTTPMKDKHGTNYKPNFSIIKWVARPAEFDNQAEQQTTSQAAPTSAPQPPAASVSEF